MNVSEIMASDLAYLAEGKAIMYVITVIFFSCVAMAFLIVPFLFIVRMIAAIFSPAQRAAISKKKLLHLLWFIASLLALAVLLPVGPGGIKVSKTARTAAEINEIQTAILAYQTEYSVLPESKDNAGLIKTLVTGNPRAIVFLNVRPSDLNSKGDFLDAWGTPLRITIIDGKPPFIQSAGPDQKWGTPDDMDNSADKP